MRSSLRLFFVGGVVSYRALFNWLNPWILVPTFILEPLFQILLFAYIGRTAAVGTDEFYLIGNAVQNAAIPCLFAMGSTIAGERQWGTLPLLLVSPARRIPLFLGRALPVIANGFIVAMLALGLGAVVLGVDLTPSTWGPLALVTAVATFSCTGLGLLAAALALRVRETAVMSNVAFGILLIFAGVNVPVAALPGWMQAISAWLPMTHGIEAARRVSAGVRLADISGLLLREAGVGVIYVGLGLVLLRVIERESRRLSTLDTY